MYVPYQVLCCYALSLLSPLSLSLSTVCMYVCLGKVLLYWDMRQTSVPIARMARSCSSNQRISFDVDHQMGRICATASDDGSILLYDLFQTPSQDNNGYLPPLSYIPLAHNGDGVNGCSFHPLWTPSLIYHDDGHFDTDAKNDSSDPSSIINNSKIALATCSGRRRFPLPLVGQPPLTTKVNGAPRPIDLGIDAPPSIDDDDDIAPVDHSLQLWNM
jgi:hypothetical protein